MEVRINAPALEVGAELEEFVRTTTSSATGNGDRGASVAFAELDRSDAGDGPVVRCFIRAEIDGRVAIQAGATGADAWEAVWKVGRLLEAGVLSRSNGGVAAPP
jgi:hypothetical protein